MPTVHCDQDERGHCDYQAKASCKAMPLVWGEYCNYEIAFIDDRFQGLKIVYAAFEKFFKDKVGGHKFWLNETILWEICFIYANDLKPVRQFHAVDGGCDRNRRAAFLARLISLHRPIYIEEMASPDVDQLSSKTILILNEHFALNAMMHFLELPAEAFGETGIGKIAKDLIFIFGHRDPQPESLVTIARLMTNLYSLYGRFIAERKRAEAAELEVKNLSARLAELR
ncbi:hypothetical protein [Azospirillum lipoferum]|uniref:Uncharacterized protein n=1 Tax=Azospirillum lipoferum (strain 4B) TaxID=862719 RepID=G7Z3I8_AZOL4|nr:hypothetical protein [Azospirillum lipoferum]CBS85952.1 protein of unknown function [Azospirillum lipoferum 4B]